MRSKFQQKKMWEFQPVHHQLSIDSTSAQADMALSQGPKTSFNLTHVLCELQNCSPLT